MAEPAGPKWCDRFPGSVSLDDLTADFSGKVKAFISQMTNGGAKVSIGATFRPPERAYLMHWCCMVANSGQDPAKIPKMTGVNIDWTCGGSIAAARTAAKQMMAKYDIQFPAALASRHTQRRAVDMSITWKGPLTLRDFNGASRTIDTAPRTGSNPALIQVGATFGVIKLVSDPPHWSDDGH